MIDEKLIDKSLELYQEYINSKHWADLTEKQIEMIVDEEKRKLYLKKYQECMNAFILPLLYNMSNKSGFKFSDPNESLTCNNMIREIYAYYQKRGYTKEDLNNIALEKNTNKKY